jgi:heme/copper-type cytochrome/quinol oxidase subunit 2
MRFDVRIVTPQEFQAWAGAHAQQPLAETSP